MEIRVDPARASILADPGDPLLDRLLETLPLAGMILPGEGDRPRMSVPKLEERDVAELTWSSGIREWALASEVLAQLTRSILRPGGRLSGERATWRLEKIRLLRVLPSKDDLSFAQQVAAWEAATGADRRLHRAGNSGDFSLPFDPGQASGSGPILLLLPALGCSLSATFGPLRGSKEWRRLQASYSGSVLGFSLASLSSDPLDEALALVDALPEERRVDVLALSGGGLVAEILARGAPSHEEAALLESVGHADLAARLARLGQEMARKRIVLGRVLRLACPVRGMSATPTRDADEQEQRADSRLPELLGQMVNLLDACPSLSGGEFPRLLQALVLSSVHRGARVEDLPGLAALLPTSMLLRFLNLPTDPVAGELAVVVANARPRGILRNLALLVTDRLGTQDHDLLMSMASGLGGVRRKALGSGARGGGEVAFHLHEIQGEDLRHYDLLSHPDVRRRVVAWFTRETDEELVPCGDPWIEDASVRILTPRDASQPVVYFVPDFMGSTLDVAGERVWLDPVALSRGHFARLRVDATDVKATGVLLSPFRGFLRLLSVNHEVRLFPWDWRLSMQKAARALARDVESVDPARAVHFAGHGAGGLVVRLLAALEPDLWERLGERGQGRLLMLGTPNFGSQMPLRLLAEGGEILAMLQRLSLPKLEPAEMLRGFPGLLELLPCGRKTDGLDPHLWKDQLGIEPPDAEALRAARTTQLLLADVPFTERTIRVGGVGAWTPSVARGGRFLGSRAGDGVCLASAESSLGRSFYVAADHARLAARGDVLTGLLELLDDGDTERLSRDLPRLVDASPTLPDPCPPSSVLHPSLPDLVHGALSGNLAQAAEARQSLNLVVTHGSVIEARHALLVGHEEHGASGWSLSETERLLDARLQNRIRRRLQLALFRGEPGTFEIIGAPRSRPEGAILLGLGPAEKLAAHLLQRPLIDAIGAWALEVHERGASSVEARSWRSAALSVHLLDPEASVDLPVEQMVALVVEAVLRCNDRLRAAELWNSVRIDEIEFIEPFSDRVVEVAHAVREVQKNLRCAVPADMPLDLPEEILRMPGARDGVPPRTPTGRQDWQRIIVTGTAEGLTFNLPGADAQSRLHHLAYQASAVTRLLEGATRDSAFRADLGLTLGNLLLPPAVLEAMQEGSEIVLNLDAVASRIPWELIGRCSPEDPSPPSLRAGLVRQLQSARFKEKPQRAARSRALVIGDPLGVYPPLPSAADEASLVVQILEETGMRVLPLIQSDGPTILRSLGSAPWSLIHASAHGRYTPDKPRESGLLIGDGLVLGVAEIARLDPVPSFVFLNACHLGRIDPGPTPDVTDPLGLAPSLAQELISMGVKAVIAAGWAVHTLAARTFARAFYRSFLSGVPFGRAVLAARQRTWEAHPDRNTFGAYQCYGDPNFVLEGPRQRRYVSSRELRSAVETLRETLRVEGPGSVPEAELIELEEAARASWRDGPLLEAFARAWGAMGRWDKALAAAEEALRQPDAPMALVESLGEYEASIAEELRTRIREASSPPPPVDLKEQRELPAFGLLVSDAEGLEDAEALRQRAEDLDRSREERLEGLLKISPSTERYMLLGSMLVDRILPPSAEAWRSNPFLEGHDALAKDPEGAASKRALLARACVAFRAALEARQRENGTLDSRAWVEWALAGLASGSTTPGQILEEARSAERRCLASPAWRGEADLALAHADILLLQHLCAPKLSPDWLPGLAALYQGVQARHRLPDAEVERHLLRAGALLAFHDPELLEFLSALSQGLFARAQNMRV